MNYMYEGRCNDITKQYMYVNTYTVGFLWVLPLIKSHLYLNLDKGRPSCSNIYALMHFCFIDNAYIISTLSLKIISQINQMNWQSDLLHEPILEDIRLTVNTTTHKWQRIMTIYLRFLASEMESIMKT